MPIFKKIDRIDTFFETEKGSVRWTDNHDGPTVTIVKKCISVRFKVRIKLFDPVIIWFVCLKIGLINGHNS